MGEKRFKDEKSCSNCRNQMTGFDGGFFGLPLTCECRIYGETEGRKNCSDFEKKITKSYLLDKIKELEQENEELQKQVESSETTSNATSNYNAFLESKITTLEEENEQLRQELNGKDCRKCGNYCRDKALDYCLVDEREPYYFSFPFGWDYKAEAEKCKYYYR